MIADPVFSTDDARLKALNAARTPTGETRGLGLALESAVAGRRRYAGALACIDFASGSSARNAR